MGLVGYEINFNRYFYRFKPPRPLGEIEADIRRIEREMVAMLREVAGTTHVSGGRERRPNLETRIQQAEKMSISVGECDYFSCHELTQTNGDAQRLQNAGLPAFFRPQDAEAAVAIHAGEGVP